MHLKKGLEEHGFHASTVDSCLFIHNDCLLLLYTDDCCIFAFNDKTIDDLCLSLGSSFLLKDEGSIEDFLGIHICHQTDDDGNIRLVMTQTGLIDQILDDVGHAGKAAYGKNTPAVGILYPSPNAQPFNAP